MIEIQQFSNQVIENVEKVIVGKRSIIELVMVALLCEGHILLEDVPGTGKTMLARSMAVSLGGSFKRLQCTPDLLPNDITGVSIFNQKTAEFEFRRGPIFVNILLADEINRATPRTQSALLEAMQEQQVSADGVTYKLSRPFMVLATQNPIEYEGTFPLPEAQLDRFLMRLPVGYPNAEEEAIILNNLRYEHPVTNLEPVNFGADGADARDGLDELLGFQRKVWDVHIDETLQQYIISIVGRTRNHPELALGASPRASLSLYKASQALAAVRGRDHVLPDDVKYLVPFTMTHRLITRPEAELRGRKAESILAEVLEATPLDLGSVSS